MILVFEAVILGGDNVVVLVLVDLGWGYSDWLLYWCGCDIVMVVILSWL